MTRIAAWLTPWKRRAPATTSLPLGLTESDIDSLAALRTSPHWKHYVAVLDRLGEQQAAVLASGLDHDKYLFVSGALTALRRVYTIADDLIAAAATLKEHEHARDRTASAARHADTFVNTPWYDSWRGDTADASRGGAVDRTRR